MSNLLMVVTGIGLLSATMPSPVSDVGMIVVSAQEGGGKKGGGTIGRVGCLQKGDSEGSYIIQNTAEKGPKTIAIVESKVKLPAHLGHQIEVTGTIVPAQEAMNMKGAPKADQYIRVESIKMVAAACKG